VILATRADPSLSLARWRARGQLHWIHFQHLFPIRLDALDCTALLPFLAFVTLALRRMIRRRRRGCRAIRFELGLTLFAFEPVDLIPQTLVVFPQGVVVRCQRLHQIEQLDDGLAGTCKVLDGVGIKTFEQGGTGLPQHLYCIEHRRESRPGPASLSMKNVAGYYLIQTGSGPSRYRELLR